MLEGGQGEDGHWQNIGSTRKERGREKCEGDEGKGVNGERERDTGEAAGVWCVCVWGGGVLFEFLFFPVAENKTPKEQTQTMNLTTFNPIL